jgi:hypothetical protein
MSLLNYKECPLVLNNKTIIATSASLSIKNPKTPVFAMGKIKRMGRAKNSTIQGSMSFNFLLSDGIFIKDLINKEQKTFTPITGNLGGIYFENARLTSLSFTIEPNSVIWADATIEFWGAPTGELGSTSQDIEIENIGTGVGSEIICIMDIGDTNEELENISSYTYEMNVEYRNIFMIGEIIPDTTISAIKEIVSVKADNIGSIIKECENITTINSIIKNGCGETFGNFDVTGDLDSQEVVSELGEFVIGSITITEEF